MRFLFAFFPLFFISKLYAEPVLRPSAQLLSKHPELMQAKQCVIYKEGGHGWIMLEPTYYLRGNVTLTRIETRRLKACPEVPGKILEQYNREEFNQHALAYPCLALGVPERDEEIGIVRISVEDWETPHAKRAANMGRLYRGMFIDQTLKKGLEIELEADLLDHCAD